MIKKSKHSGAEFFKILIDNKRTQNKIWDNIS